MTLYEFKLLSKQEQASTTWEKGVFLSSRKGSGFAVSLYQVDGFYVEVYYNSTENKIESIKSFTTTTLLEPYLSSIDISDVLF